MPVIQPFDTDREQPISLVQAAQFFPKGAGDKTVAIATLTKWIQYGTRRRSRSQKVKPTTVQLQGNYAGSALVTSRESIQRFNDKLNRSLDGEGDGTPDRSEESRDKSHESAAEELSRAGY